MPLIEIINFSLIKILNKMGKKSVSILLFAVLGAVCFFGHKKQQSENNHNALQLSNIEALTQDNRPTIPCAVDGDERRVPAKDANNNDITMVVPGYRKV